MASLLLKWDSANDDTVFILSFQVSRSWHAVINSCELYWKLQCIQSGVFQDLDLLQNEMLKFGSFKGLFSALLKFKARFKPENLTLRENKLDTKQCIPLSKGYYYSCPTCRNASVSVYNTRSTSSEQASSSTIEQVFPHGYPSVVWSSSSENGVLLCTNNGKWLMFDFPADFLLPNSVHVWEEDSIRSYVYHVAGSCPNCCFIVIMGKRRNLESLWELELLQLRKEHRNVIAVKTTFLFFPNDLDSSATSLEAGEGLDPFRVHRVSVLPLHQSFIDSCLNDFNSTKHWLLIQFGYAVVMFELSASTSYCSASAPLKVWCPNHQPQDYLFPNATACLLSKDMTIVALCKSNNMEEVNLWNIENGREYRVVVPNQSKNSKVQSCKCLAIGHLFTVVAKCCGGCLPTIYVISTGSGVVICESDLNAIKSPIASKITSDYDIMQKANYIEQHKELLNSIEAGPCQIWLDTLGHSGLQNLCVVACLSARGSSTVTFVF